MIALGSDHAGFPLKEAIKKYLDGEGVEYIDCGAYDFIQKPVSEAAVIKLIEKIKA